MSRNNSFSLGKDKKKAVSKNLKLEDFEKYADITGRLVLNS